VFITVVIFTASGSNPLLGCLCGIIVSVIYEDGSELVLEKLNEWAISSSEEEEDINEEN